MPLNRLIDTTVPVCLLAAALLFSTASFARACPFCGAPQVTLGEQLSRSDAAALLQWIDAAKGTEDKAGSTTLEIVQVPRHSRIPLKAGERLTLGGYRAGKKGDLFFAVGKSGDPIDWSRPIEITETGYQYIVQAPSLETAEQQRLAYFLKFLEFPDSLIANDAFNEFTRASYQDVAALAGNLPRDRIRKWLKSEKTPQNRLGLYGLMLGLCGNEEDARWLESQIDDISDEFRFGIDGMIGGYLILTGESGLKFIEQHRLRNRDVPDGEVYAVMQALRFLWEYDATRFKKEQLWEAMRLPLDRPALAELVIRDLARWKDWSVQARLMELYATDGYNNASVKQAIAGYMLASTRDVTKGEQREPEHAAAARRYLAQLREKDADIVRKAERQFGPM